MQNQESLNQGEQNMINDYQNQSSFIRERVQQMDPFQSQDIEIFPLKDFNQRQSQFSKRQDDLNQSKLNNDSIHRKMGGNQNEIYYSPSLSGSKESDKDEGSRNSKHGKKQNFSKESTSVLKRWLIENVEHPYLKAADKIALSRESGLTKKQVQNWFTNVRKRIWQPLMNKFKNKKDLKKIILKLKLKLDSSEDGSSIEEQQSHLREAQGLLEQDQIQSLNSQKLIFFPGQEVKVNVKNDLLMINIPLIIQSQDKEQILIFYVLIFQSTEMPRISNLWKKKSRILVQIVTHLCLILILEFNINYKRSKKSQKNDMPDDTKVTHYLQELDKFNKQQKEKRSNIIISENNSNGSNNGQENASGSRNGSNLAYLDSTTGNKNVSGTGASGSGGNTSNIQYVPILMICCPNILKNEPCFCGNQQFLSIPSNLQMQQLINIILQNSNNNGTCNGSTSSQNLPPVNTFGQGGSWLTGSTMASFNNNNQLDQQDQQIKLQMSLQNNQNNAQVSNTPAITQPTQPLITNNSQQNFYYQQSGTLKSQIPQNQFQTFCNSSESSGNGSRQQPEQQSKSNYWNINFPNVHLPKPSISQIHSLSNSSNGSNGGSKLSLRERQIIRNIIKL